MIKLANNSIMLLDYNGVISSFEPDSLQAKIIRCFIAAGLGESWIAEDITMAVEFALEHSTRENRIFTLSEINSTVVKILGDTGFPEVADIYQRGNVCSKITYNAEADTVSKLISKHLGLSGRHLEVLTGKVLHSTRKLDITTAPPTLFVELAKYYETEEFACESLDAINLPKWQQSSQWLVTREAIYEQLRPETCKLLDANLIRMSAVSRLFPAVKLTFMISDFARFRELTPPLTEMILIPYLYSVGKALNDCAAVASNLCRKNTNQEQTGLPVFLTIPDMSGFAIQMLEASWPEAENDCREMLSPIREALSNSLFKLKMN
ncbi:MAG: hypothetical protein WC071_04280 [Victivallaceae bacterium]